MFKLYQDKKGIIALSIVVTMLPIIAGIILWAQLPDQVPTHFGMDGQPNGWSSKAFAVFGLPVILVAVQCLCLLLTGMDPKRRNITWKPFGLLLWICPAVSILCAGVTYMAALNIPLNINLIVYLFSGVLFLVIGNYLPKCQQNYTMGIKIAWTLNDEANWNYTHRLAGKVWIMGGLVIMLTAFLNLTWLLMPAILVMVLVPVIASYLYYRRHHTED